MMRVKESDVKNVAYIDFELRDEKRNKFLCFLVFRKQRIDQAPNIKFLRWTTTPYHAI